jgi:pyroglutamyl-peptidase
MPFARGRTSVLITGFGPFPGVPVNATMRLVPELAFAAARLYPDLRITAEILPTEWGAAPRRLEALLGDIAPDLALHFGVSNRARGFEVERRACNVNAGLPDAAGNLPPADAIHPGGADFMSASLPVSHIVARLRLRGIQAFVSRDAGTYLCNCLLYHTLAAAPPNRRAGFIHLPATLARPGGPNRGRTGACPLTWEQALEGGLEILATCLGRASQRPA